MLKLAKMASQKFYKIGPCPGIGRLLDGVAGLRRDLKNQVLRLIYTIDLRVRFHVFAVNAPGPDFTLWCVF